MLDSIEETNRSQLKLVRTPELIIPPLRSSSSTTSKHNKFLRSLLMKRQPRAQRSDISRVPYSHCSMSISASPTATRRHHSCFLSCQTSRDVAKDGREVESDPRARQTLPSRVGRDSLCLEGVAVLKLSARITLLKSSLIDCRSRYRFTFAVSRSSYEKRPGRSTTGNASSAPENKEAERGGTRRTPKGHKHHEEKVDKKDGGQQEAWLSLSSSREVAL